MEPDDKRNFKNNNIAVIFDHFIMKKNANKLFSCGFSFTVVAVLS